MYRIAFCSLCFYRIVLYDRYVKEQREEQRAQKHAPDLGASFAIRLSAGLIVVVVVKIAI